MKMTKSILAMVVALAAMFAQGGDSAPFVLDTREERGVESSIVLPYDAAWIGGDSGATVVIEDNSTIITNATGVGDFTHTLTGDGRHELTYTTYIGGVAEDEVYTATVFKGWAYEVDDNDDAILVDTAYKSGDVVIPHEIDGHTVIGIGERAFEGCEALTSVTIPDSVASIGEEAFAGCAGLLRVDAPKALRAMIESRNVFKDCADNLEIVYFGPEISEVVVKQRYPWNGLVDISFTVTGMENSSRDYGLVVMAMIPDIGKIRKASHCHLVRDGLLSDSLAVNANGNYRLLWDAEADLGKVYYENLIVRVDVAGYVVDDSSGDSAPFVFDTVTSSAPSLRDAVSISYDAAWIGGDSGATVVIEDNGVEIARKTGAGEFEYQLTGEGRHNLTYKTLINGVEQEEQYAATILDSIEFGDMYAYKSSTITRTNDVVSDKHVCLEKSAILTIYTGAWLQGSISFDGYAVFEVIGAKSKDEIRPVVENLGFRGSATATVLSDEELRRMVMPPLSTSGEWDFNYGEQCYEYEDDSAEYEWPKDLWPDNTAVSGRFWVAVKLEPSESMRWYGIDGSVRVWQSGANVQSDKFYSTYYTDDTWPCYNDASGLFRGITINTKSSGLGVELRESDLLAYDSPLCQFWLESAPAEGSPLSITLPEAGVLYMCAEWTGDIGDIQVQNADSVSQVTRFTNLDKYSSLDDEAFYFECGCSDRYSCYLAITVNSARTITLERGMRTTIMTSPDFSSSRAHPRPWQ